MLKWVDIEVTVLLSFFILFFCQVFTPMAWNYGGIPRILRILQGFDFFFISLLLLSQSYNYKQNKKMKQKSELLWDALSSLTADIKSFKADRTSRNKKYKKKILYNWIKPTPTWCDITYIEHYNFTLNFCYFFSLKQPHIQYWRTHFFEFVTLPPNRGPRNKINKFKACSLQSRNATTV